ncbi:MAG: DUF402 domain-containing protein [Candidatus Baldrarchaeia archaeon]
MVKARVKGIYATALSKLLIDHGYSLTQCSKTIENRLKISSDFDAPDVDIKDSDDHHSIIISGKKELVDNVIKILTDTLPNPIIYKSKVAVNSIYLGVVDEISEEGSVIDLGHAKGVIPGKELELGSKVLVRVINPGIKYEQITLSDELTIPGKYAILIPSNTIKISKKIRNPDTRQTLLALGLSIKPPNWGILWRTAASAQSMQTLIEEVKYLKQIAEDISSAFERENPPKLLFEGEYIAIVELPYESKCELDKIRSEVTPTIKGHHYYKSLGRCTSMLVDMAENMLSSLPRAGDSILQTFNNIISGIYPKIGDILQITHIKLDGRVFELTPGRILSVRRFNGEISFTIKRQFREGGYYDGLDVPKERGDYGITEIKVGNWYMKTRYFSSTGKLKGEYYNISTGIEFIPPNKIRYIDLAVDLVKYPDGTVKVLDIDELKRAAEEGYISKRTYDNIMEKVKYLEELLKEGKEPG